MFICDKDEHCIDCPKNYPDEQCEYWSEVDYVKHGHWVEMERGHYFKCSECRNPIPYKFGYKLYNEFVASRRYYHYCPNCGAKMDEDFKRE